MPVPSDSRSTPPSASRSAREAPTLFEALATLARRAPDTALASAATGGLLGVVGMIFASPDARLFLLPLIALGAFGLWGMLERERATSAASGDAATSEPRRPRTLVGVVQWLAVAIGTAAAVVGALALLGAVFGTVIS